MRLPNINDAVVPDAKISGYLLAVDHPAGRGKAQFFLRPGFRGDQPAVLGTALLQHAASLQASSQQRTPFGVKYLIDGCICSPSGATAQIRSVWFVDSNERCPRFVTAYPLQRKQG